MITILSMNSDSYKANRYVLFLLESLRKNSELLIACTGKHIDETLFDKVSQYADSVYSYDSDFDINRWKDILTSKIGKDELKNYQDLLLINDSMFGPIYPLSDVLARLRQFDADFLGLTAHGKIKNYFRPVDRKIWPRFIQPYFLMIRQPMLSSEDFLEYLKRLPDFKTYEDVLKGFEFIFTETFEQMGYHWEVLCDMSDKEDSTGRFFESFILFDIYELITEKRFPFIPKYAFDIDYSEIQIYNPGNDLRKSLSYIESATCYDVNLIYQNLICRKNLQDIINHLNLFYIIDEKQINTQFKGKCALFAYLFYEDLIDYSLEKILNVPENMDIYIATDTEQKQERIINQLKRCRVFSRSKVLLHSGKGRDISALLVTFRPYLMDYEIVGFIHDKKSSQMAYATVGQAFNLNSWENMLNSRAYVNGVLDLFAQNSLLGFLSPPLLLHNTYFHTGIDAWTICREEVLTLAKRLDVHANLDFDKNPVALGSVFWCRTAAMKKLFEYNFRFSDFPDEPMPVDGTISHAIERLFPYVAQSEGLYTGYIMTKEAAVDNLTFYRESLNLIMRELKDLRGVKAHTLRSTIQTVRFLNKRKVMTILFNKIKRYRHRL